MNTYIYSQQRLGARRHAIVQRGFDTYTHEYTYTLIWLSHSKSVCTGIRKQMQKDGQQFTDKPFDLKGVKFQ